MRRFTSLVFLALTVLSCSNDEPSSGGFLIVTTVSPLTDIARNVAGNAAEVQGIVPEGVDSHTFEPTPSSARTLGKADVVFINGLHLEDPTLELARTNKKTHATILLLGDNTIGASEYVYDFSFPRSEGKPNPHLWMDVQHAIRYAELMRDHLVERDPDNADAYRMNTESYLTRLRELDRRIKETVATIPSKNRVLLTYHDSFAYFARRYGMRVIGAVQPSDFAEPSARDVARLIDQIESEKVPAIFGSEVFRSTILRQIARETGVRFEETLRDDDLPGEPGDAEHSYIGMMLYDVRTMAEALGGSGHPLAGMDPKTPYD